MLIGKPKNWDDQTDAHCGALWIRRKIENGIPFMQSAWFPTPDELAILNQGGGVLVGLSANSHPVIHVGVTNRPDQFEHCPLTYIEANDPNAQKVVVWDEALDQPCILDCLEVNVAEGWVVFYQKDAEGKLIVKDDKLVTERRNGAFSLKWRKGFESRNPTA